MALAAHDVTQDGEALRPAEEVMALDRLGALHPTRLSFARTLTRRMCREGWRVGRERFEIDADGVGRAVYAIHGRARRPAASSPGRWC